MAQTARDSLREKLSTGIYKVTFLKLDGTERTMRCTLKQDVIGESFTGTGTRAVNESVLPVFDVDLNEWRSFKLANVSQVEAV